MKKIICLIISGILSFLIWATISCACENIKIDMMIEDFIAKGKLVEEYSDDANKYYKVQSEEELDLNTYTVKNSRVYPGGPGDIILTRIAAVDIPILYAGVSFYVGGHAGLACFPYEDDDQFITTNDSFEITGLGDTITAGSSSKNYWYTPTYNVIMAVRVKTSLENRFKAFNRALSSYGENYNYTFMFNQNHTKYCSDLVSQAYKYVGIDLNYDNVATTVVDVLASPNVYLSYLTIVDSDKVRHTYILAN